MAMRKMGNSMKIITIIIALCMIIPIAIQGYAFLFNRESKTVLLKIDGEKIYKEDFDKLYKEVNTQLKQLVVATPEGDNKDKNLFFSFISKDQKITYCKRCIDFGRSDDRGS